MPMYQYLCPGCNKLFDGWAKMDERRAPQLSACCGRVSDYRISAPRVFCDFPAYQSPASGRWIEGRRARSEDFARTNTRPYDPGEMQDGERRAKLEEAKLDSQIDATVEKTLSELKNG
jgi:hypothetical protein